MSAWKGLAEVYVAPADLELPSMKRQGLAILGEGFLGKRRYRNLLRIGSSPSGLVLELLAGQPVLVPWVAVRAGKAPWGIVPQETWLLGEEEIPLTVRKGTVQRPV